MMVTLSAQRRERLQRRGLRLEYTTLGWNAVEIGFLIVAAVAASSVALSGFALDSCIEIFASIVVIRQLKGVESPQGDQRALRRIGVAFLLLAVYILVQVVVTLALGIRPDSSPLGIAWLAATCLVMLGLAVGKSRTGRLLDNPVLGAEAKVTVVDAALAAGILVGLVLNASFGWWWADIAGARSSSPTDCAKGGSTCARQAEPRTRTLDRRCWHRRESTWAGSQHIDGGDICRVEVDRAASRSMPVSSTTRTASM